MRRPDNVPLSSVIVKKSWNLKFLENSGTMQACNGTDLPAKLYWVMWQHVVEWRVCCVQCRVRLLGGVCVVCSAE